MDRNGNSWSCPLAQSSGTIFRGSTSQIFSSETNNNTWSRQKLSSMEKKMIENSIDSMRHRIDQIQQLPDVDDEPTVVISTDVYKNFDFDTASSKHLPIYSSKDAILEAIERHYATIIVGNTGCGKTTQVCIFKLLCSISFWSGISEFFVFFTGATNNSRRCTIEKQTVQHHHNTTTTYCGQTGCNRGICCYYFIYLFENIYLFAV